MDDFHKEKGKVQINSLVIYWILKYSLFKIPLATANFVVHRETLYTQLNVMVTILWQFFNQQIAQDIT